MHKLVVFFIFFFGLQSFGQEGFEERLHAYQLEKNWSIKAHSIVDLCLSAGATYREDIKQEGVKLLKQSEIQNKEDWEIVAKFVLGFVLKDEGKPDFALELIQECETKLLNQENFSLLAYTLLTKGHCYKLKGQFKESIDAYSKAKSTWKQLNNNLEVNLANSHIAASLGSLKHYQKAENLLTQCIKELLPFKKYRTISNYFGSLGEIYSQQNKKVLAKTNFEKAAEYAIKSKDYGTLAKAKNYLAIAEYYGGNTEKSIELFRQSLEYRIKAGDIRLICEGYYNLGSLFMEEKDFPKAESNFLLSLEYGEKYNLKNEQADAILELANLEKAKGNFEKSNIHLTNYIALKEEIVNELTTNRDEEYSMMADFAKKKSAKNLEESENQLNEKLKKERNRNILFLCIGSITLLLFVLFVLRREKKAANSNDKEQSAESLAHEPENID